MTKGLSVVMPCRNEAMCEFTVRRLLETRQGVDLDIIVVEDGSDRKYVFPDAPAGSSVTMIRLPQPIGLCYCRDLGIEAAKNDAVLVLDAHSNFWDDDGYAEYLVDHAHTHTNHIGCAISVQLRENEMDMEPARGRYWGARVILFDKCRTGRYTIFPSKWDGSAKTLAVAGQAGEIQSILGGAYLLNRAWYFQIGRPWRYLRGWGTSEQNISIPNWLMGGMNVLLPVEIGHMYRTGDYDSVPYKTFFADIYYNQIRLASVLPVPDELRDRLIAHVYRNNIGKGDDMRIAAHTEACPVQGYADLLTAGPRSWAEYAERWNVDTSEWEG